LYSFYAIPDACAKLNKKHEPEMSPEIKNGIVHTIYIYAGKLFCLLALFIILPPSALSVNSEKEWIIVLDPGHGGRDPGALGSSSSEKNITLSIAFKTGKYLEQNLNNVKVIYTRDKDVTVDLSDRPKIANKNNADLFISIHANWANQKNIAGTETFVMGLAKDQENLEVAMKENEVILLEENYTTKYEGFDPKSTESYIMFSLMQNVFQKQSADLASRIQTQFRERYGRYDRGVKQAGFWVLFNTIMPSILIETGFITNPAEEKYLNSEQGQDYIASGIFRACRDYINEIKSKSGISVLSSEAETDSSGSRTVSSGSILFRVQIGASVTPRKTIPENFKGLTDVNELNYEGRNIYVTGAFPDYPAAVRYRQKIAAIYPDAFIIAVRDNKLLPLQQALDQKERIK
jgi:N-acetylmuramoyl-L-alanine amidase